MPKTFAQPIVLFPETVLVLDGAFREYETCQAYLAVMATDLHGITETSRNSISPKIASALVAPSGTFSLMILARSPWMFRRQFGK